MRLKVESVPPLPHVKAWFSAHALPSVLDLKASLCADLHALSDAHIKPEDILLLLDDFELLDSSSIDVVRDGDLIVYVSSPILSAHVRAFANGLDRCRASAPKVWALSRI
ncbi:hypothetical protein FKP32DRAFT_60375 [Trametes sanguinea]|nr:hypothetical protein FKP32DRAFT_60375 [Trametes sanguinea]